MEQSDLSFHKKAKIEELTPKELKKKKQNEIKEKKKEEVLSKIKEIYCYFDDIKLLEKTNYSLEKTLEIISGQEERLKIASAKKGSAASKIPTKELSPNLIDDDEEYLKLMLNECEESFCYEAESGKNEDNNEQFEKLLKEIQNEYSEESSKQMDTELINCFRKEINFWMSIEAAYEEENNLEEINSEFYEDNPQLLIELQKYIEELIGLDVVKSKKNVMFNPNTPDYQQGFPSLSNTSNNKDIRAGFDSLTYIEKNNMLNNSKKQEEERKLGVNSLLSFGEDNKYRANSRSEWDPKNMSVFHTSKDNSQEEVKKLSQQFRNVQLKELKFIYSSLGENFEITREFLLKKHRLTPQKKKPVTKSKIGKPYQDYYSDDEDKNELDKLAGNLVGESYDSLRDEIKYHMSMKYIFSKTASDSAIMSKHNESSKLRSKAKEHESQLMALMAASKKKFLDKLQKANNFIKIDLHGLYLEEALDILHDQIKYIKIKINNKQVQNYNTQDFNSQKCLIYEIITGKGLHSVNRKSILTPGIIKYLREKKYMFKGFEKDGKIYLYFPL